MKLTVIQTDNTDPYVNLATEEYITFNAEEDEIILFLWQNAHTVVIGKNQNPWRECNVEAIKRDNIYLARRMSGGGAVYHDLGNLNFTFIAKDGLFDVERQTDVILLACRLLGINAAKTGRNDLTVTGRKFSGHAYFSSHGFNYHHGTIMMDVKGDDLSKYLNVSAAKLKSKGVESVRSRVTNLREHVDGALGSADTKELILAMQDAMIKAASREYGCEAVMEELPQIPQELLDKYASEEWRLGTKIPFTRNIEHRFEWGGVEIQLAMKGEYIRDCRIYSDALETEVFDVLENLIKDCRYDAGDIQGLSARLPEGTSATAHEILGLIAKSI
jgi:lipoate-protein ligase A